MMTALCAMLWFSLMNIFRENKRVPEPLKYIVVNFLCYLICSQKALANDPPTKPGNGLIGKREKKKLESPILGKKSSLYQFENDRLIQIINDTSPKNNDSIPLSQNYEILKKFKSQHEEGLELKINMMPSRNSCVEKPKNVHQLKRPSQIGHLTRFEVERPSIAGTDRKFSFVDSAKALAKLNGSTESVKSKSEKLSVGKSSKKPANNANAESNNNNDLNVISVLNKFMFYVFLIFILCLNLFGLYIFPYYLKKPLSINED
jgi:hypothetical protein